MTEVWAEKPKWTQEIVKYLDTCELLTNKEEEREIKRKVVQYV